VYKIPLTISFTQVGSANTSNVYSGTEGRRDSMVTCRWIGGPEGRAEGREERGGEMLVYAWVVFWWRNGDNW
jgi:hypothetical protein